MFKNDSMLLIDFGRAKYINHIDPLLDREIYREGIKTVDELIQAELDEVDFCLQDFNN